MNTTAFTQRDNLIAISILPFYYAIFNVMLFGWTYVERLDVFVYATISIVLIWTPIYFLHALPAIYLRRLFPAVRQTWQRMGLAMLIHMSMSALTVYSFFYGYDWVAFPGYVFNQDRLHTMLLIGWCGNLAANVIHESVYAFERWSQTLHETEKLRKANLQSQLEGLKQQVNPHFLFNSLNSLSSLIDDDPERAEQFVEELSSVYRYLLQNNVTELTSLSAELRFIRSYFHLQQTRYGSGLTMQLDTNPAFLDTLIPPLTLQLLVENAIKHNVVAADQPLHIRIHTTPDARLVVTNNRQPKIVRVLSTGVGLTNIAGKYRLLNQPDVLIEERDGQFTVTLPLLPADFRSEVLPHSSAPDYVGSPAHLTV